MLFHVDLISNKHEHNYNFACKLNSYIREYGLEAEMTDTAKVVVLQAISVALSCYYMHSSYNKDYRILVNEINEMKKWSYFQEAIWCHRNKVILK